MNTSILKKAARLGVVAAFLFFALLPAAVPRAAAKETPVAGEGGDTIQSQDFMFDLRSITNPNIKTEQLANEGINYIFRRIIAILAASVGAVSMLFIAIGGIKMLVSGGDEAMYDKGKANVKYALIGLALALLSYFLVTGVQLLIKSFENFAAVPRAMAMQDESTSTLAPEEKDKVIQESLVPDADTVSKCGSKEVPLSSGKIMLTPKNCLFLEEPIGGKAGTDLYKRSCVRDPKQENAPEGCRYVLWHGEAITADEAVVQAILSSVPGQEGQGPFGLLYSYVGLIYRYLSGLILGIVILVIIIGGIQITTAQGDHGKVEEGRKRVVGAVVGMVLWFLASLILYTVNPTFFAFG